MIKSKCKIIKHLEENMGENFPDLGLYKRFLELYKRFLDMISRGKSTEEIDKLDYQN